MLQTHKTITAAFTTRFNDMWKGVYRILYDNTTLSPAPLDSETWLEFSILFGGTGSISGKRISINGDCATDRFYGIVRVRAHTPLNSHVAVLKDITDLVGKTFSGRFWVKPDFTFIFPSELKRKEKIGSKYVGTIDTGFHFDKRTGEVDNTSLSPSVVTAFTNAGSPLLTLTD